MMKNLTSLPKGWFVFFFFVAFNGLVRVFDNVIRSPEDSPLRFFWIGSFIPDAFCTIFLAVTWALLLRAWAFAQHSMSGSGLSKPCSTALQICWGGLPSCSRYVSFPLLTLRRFHSARSSQSALVVILMCHLINEEVNFLSCLCTMVSNCLGAS